AHLAHHGEVPRRGGRPCRGDRDRQRLARVRRHREPRAPGPGCGGPGAHQGRAPRHLRGHLLVSALLTYGPGERKRRVLIIVENLPVPFDRRVWQEATTLRDAGHSVYIISPTGK